MSAVLFACSKCFSRHPFEELSTGQQLCKVKEKCFVYSVLAKIEIAFFFKMMQTKKLFSTFRTVNDLRRMYDSECNYNEKCQCQCQENENH